LVTDREGGLTGSVGLAADLVLIDALVEHTDAPGAAVLWQRALAALLKREGAIQGGALTLGLARATSVAIDADPLDRVAFLVGGAVIVEGAVGLRDRDACAVLALLAD
jgi:hypothetical protein